MNDCIDYGGTGIRAPRLKQLWEKLKGPIPEGLYILHTCHHARCKNIEHLHLGTQKENIRECIDVGHFFCPGGWNKGSESSQETKLKQSISMKGKNTGQNLALSIAKKQRDKKNMEEKMKGGWRPPWWKKEFEQSYQNGEDWQEVVRNYKVMERSALHETIHRD